MGVEMIKDRQGKDHLVLSDEDFYNDDIMGDKLEDYEILQVFSSSEASVGKEISQALSPTAASEFAKDNPSGFTLKVRSKFNSKIYAMKKIDAKYIENTKEVEETIKNEFNALKEMKSPNITKYYKFFFQDSCLYILFEFLNNNDLEGFLKAYKSLNSPIDTNTLWNIFMQCISSLKYIHNKNIIHKNIKLSNIFMSENNIVKLGDFRFSFLENNEKLIEKNAKYLTPEMNNYLHYDKKTDVYAMGIIFHQLCYFTHINNPHLRKNEGVYPKEMENIIQLMLKEDENEIIDTNDLFDKIMEQYIKNVAKITSVDSVFRCMFSFINFTQIMLQKEEMFQEEVTPIAFTYINCIKAYKNGNNNNENAIYLNIFRNLLYNNSQMNNELEIKPSLVLDFLLNKLNKETGSNFNAPSLGIYPNDFKQNKDESLSEFMKYFNENFTSDISKHFICFLRRIRVCKKCNEGYYSFNLFPFIEFNLDISAKYSKFENWFKEQNEHYLELSESLNIECQKCSCITPHNEFKQFYQFPQNFIISLNRGEGFKINKKINYPTVLDLTNIVEKKDSNSKFNLVGVVKRAIDKKGNEYYYAIYLDPYQNCWFCTDKYKFGKINGPKDYDRGLDILLFYSSHQDNIGL